jgi:hypothetical protein
MDGHVAQLLCLHQLLPAAFAACWVPAQVRCDVLRDGKRLSMTVTLGERGMSCE